MLGGSAREIGKAGLFALALLVQLVAAPREIRAQAEGARSPAGAPRAEGQRVYVVGEGETLWRVAFEHGVALEDLARVNGIEDPARIRAGQRLIIPTHGVRAARVDALLERAEQALARAQFERAQQLALAARGELQHEGDTAQRVRLELIDAIVEVAYGRDEAAVGSLERALAADPDLALDPHSTTPKLLAALELARSRRNAASLPPVSAPIP